MTRRDILKEGTPKLSFVWLRPELREKGDKEYSSCNQSLLHNFLTNQNAILISPSLCINMALINSSCYTHTHTQLPCVFP